MSWHTSRMVAVDVETTGVDVDTDRIVTAAIIHLGGGQATDRPEGFPLLLNPGVDIPEQATAIHGVTSERARAEGIPAAEGIARITAELANALAVGVPIVAMNASYDLSLLDRECRRHGIEPLTERAASPAGPRVQVIDPFVIDKWADQYRKGSRKLSALCDHYQVTLDGAHSADADALAAARVAYRLGQRSQMSAEQLAGLGYDRRATARWGELASMDMAALHAAQVGWRADQAAGLQAHFRKTRFDAVVPGEWPIIPAPQPDQGDPWT